MSWNGISSEVGEENFVKMTFSFQCIFSICESMEIHNMNYPKEPENWERRSFQCKDQGPDSI